MDKTAIYKREYEKLVKIFENVEEDKKKLAEGLIQDAAFLFAENHNLVELMNKTGMVKVHPMNPGLQKRTEAAKQYLSNANTYSTIIKSLNSILNNNAIEEDDAFEAWMKNKQKE